MTEKQLKNLSRVDLMELLLEQTKYVDSLEQELSALRKKLKYAEQNVGSEPGTMADASMRVSGVFEAADQAARQYVDRAVKYEQQKHAECDMILAEAKERAMDMLKKTYAHCDALVREAEARAGIISNGGAAAYPEPPEPEPKKRAYQDYYSY
ncbi:MAG: hypothetical protein Q4F31_06995 [Eubacteriales bacterium]|nr:hypothetical protein [Eubacteriales bacterium]